MEDRKEKISEDFSGSDDPEKGEKSPANPKESEQETSEAATPDIEQGATPDPEQRVRKEDLQGAEQGATADIEGNQQEGAQVTDENKPKESTPLLGEFVTLEEPASPRRRRNAERSQRRSLSFVQRLFGFTDDRDMCMSTIFCSSVLAVCVFAAYGIYEFVKVVIHLLNRRRNGN